MADPIIRWVRSMVNSAIIGLRGRVSWEAWKSSTNKRAGIVDWSNCQFSKTLFWKIIYLHLAVQLRTINILFILGISGFYSRIWRWRPNISVCKSADSCLHCLIYPGYSLRGFQKKTLLQHLSQCSVYFPRSSLHGGGLNSIYRIIENYTSLAIFDVV